MKEFFLEIKVLFGLGKWYRVFNSREDALASIPNQKAIIVHVGKIEVCLARNQNQIMAFFNECPHHQMPLNRGTFNEKKDWICPYHSHCFDMQTGKNMTMPETNKLALFYVKESPNGIFIYKSN